MVLAWIFGAVVAAVAVGAGLTKLADLDRSRERLGYRRREYLAIGTAEVVAGVCIIGGLVWDRFQWLAVAASIGMAALMVGALIAHARVEDETPAVIPAVMVFVLSILSAIFIAIL